MTVVNWILRILSILFIVVFSLPVFISLFEELFGVIWGYITILIQKIIEIFQYSRKAVFLFFLFPIMFFSILFAIISKIKKKPKIRARYWMKMFQATLTLFFLFAFVGVVIDYIIIEDAKPIIYLYPTEETEVLVTLGRPENLTHTYPKYQDIWRVTAQPNGDLKDDKGRSYYALYWEGVSSNTADKKDGFIVKGSDTIA